MANFSVALKDVPELEFQSRYSSGVDGVVSLYGTLLRGVITNTLFIMASFTFLVIYNWHVATVTLGFLVMVFSTGPTDLADDAATSVQKGASTGVKELNDVMDNGPTLRTTPGLDGRLLAKHEREILNPMKRSLWRQMLFASSIDTYIHFLASFLTVVVVIAMSWQVFDGTMDASEVLGIFFVFVQLQRPAVEISSVVITSAAKGTAHLDRLNRVIFPATVPSRGEERNGGGSGAGGKKGPRNNNKTISKKSGFLPYTPAGSSQASVVSGIEGLSSASKVMEINNVSVGGASVSNLSLTFRAKETVRLTGPHREDVAGIVSGMIASKGGQIRLMGKMITLRSELVNATATIFSSPSLLCGTVEWNVSASRPNASLDDISAALYRAGIPEHEVERLPGGLTADVGVARVRWTDALLIRLSVARTLLRRPVPRIWVLPNFAAAAGGGTTLEMNEWRELAVLLNGIVKEEGGVLVISTADSAYDALVSDRVVDLVDQAPTTAEILEEENSMVSTSNIITKTLVAV